MADITIVEYTNAALDVAYNRTAGGMLRQIKALSSAPGSQLQRALSDLEMESARLEAEAARMETDNAQLEKTLRAIAAIFAATAALILANDNAIQASGQEIAIPAVTVKVFLQLSGVPVAAGKNPINPALVAGYKKQLDALGISWNLPRALDFSGDYVGSSAWISRMDGWGDGYAKLITDTVLQGIQSGWGPGYTAGQVRALAEGMPFYAAENLTRTLQLTAYRDASAAMDNINGDFIEYKLRVAKLDDRTCLSCIERHGSRLEKGERVDDHYRGRCTEFYVVKGGPRHPETMQADSLPGDRRFVPWQTGPEWFNSLPENRQKQQASFIKTPAKWNAFLSGVPLSDFVGNHQDSVFGNQIIEKSLIMSLGKDAAQYYQRKAE